MLTGIYLSSLPRPPLHLPCPDLSPPTQFRCSASVLMFIEAIKIKSTTANATHIFCPILWTFACYLQFASAATITTTRNGNSLWFFFSYPALIDSKLKGYISHRSIKPSACTCLRFWKTTGTRDLQYKLCIQIYQKILIFFRISSHLLKA